MRTQRYSRRIEPEAIGAPLGNEPEPMSRQAIANLGSWMVNSYGSAAELDYLAAVHGRYSRAVDEALAEAEERVRVQATVRAAVFALPLIEAVVISMRYGLWERQPMSLRALGAALGLSHTAVATYERRAIAALHVALVGKFTKGEPVHDIYRDIELSECTT